ncbi:50S ribosomal protein L13 [Armatimonas sp.]|uniref:50S ribosomal protein L13 n=1 Tax=Armatimonas sp. TaxID=1872638 RepID=UPI00286B4EAA|nr:50S ribosomal protein L13 [Armatimonas sp.]
MKTYAVKADEIQRDWIVLDATGVPMGRLAAKAAAILRGKTKAIFSPHMDCGDHVIIINAERTILTGNNKGDEPIYRHTLYPGGLKQVPRAELLEKRPDYAVLRTVKGMLPHNRLGAQMLTKLRVYAGENHPHEAQIKGAAKAKAEG